MTTFMQRGAAWHGQQAQSAAGRTVSIIRSGSELAAGLDAWRKAHTHEIADSEGFATQVESWDWGFVASELPSGFTFREGDLIAEAVGTDTQKFEVMRIGNLQCVEPADSSGILLVVHSKRVA